MVEDEFGIDLLSREARTGGIKRICSTDTTASFSIKLKSFPPRFEHIETLLSSNSAAFVFYG